MSITPAGPISLSMEHLRNSLAGSANLREWMKAADEAAAKKKIHYIDLPMPRGAEYTRDELELLRPSVVIVPAGSAPFRSDCSIGIPRRGGRLQIDMMETVPPDRIRDGTIDPEWILRFLNYIGLVIVDLEDQSEEAGKLCGPEIDMPHDVVEARVVEMPDSGTWIGATINVRWNGM